MAPAVERAKDGNVVCGEEMTYRQLVVHPQTALAPWPLRTQVTKCNLKYSEREEGGGIKNEWVHFCSDVFLHQ